MSCHISGDLHVHVQLFYVTRHRHPTNNGRPDAAMIAQWLSRPDPQLLRWSEEDRALHPEASLLGAELEAAVELYKELQETYKIRSD